MSRARTTTLQTREAFIERLEARPAEMSVRDWLETFEFTPVEYAWAQDYERRSHFRQLTIGGSEVPHPPPRPRRRCPRCGRLTALMHDGALFKHRAGPKGELGVHRWECPMGGKHP